MTTELRWAHAAGFGPDELAALTPEEADDFDSLCFGRYGPDQVTHGVEREKRYQELLQKITDYAQ